MANRHDLDERLLDYGARTIKLVESIPNTIAGRRIGDQLLRSGTSVGAHYQEACGAESRADFVHKLQVGLKELRESTYWLRLIVRANVLAGDRLMDLIEEATQLRAILSKSVATAKQRAIVSSRRSS
jgi:four helix bundle protein